MGLMRFEGAFHQSDLKSYLGCPRSFYYGRVMELDREKVSMANLGGRAGHSALEFAHNENVWTPKKIYDAFVDYLEIEKTKAIKREQEIHGSIDLENYEIMLREYASKPYNREAEMLLMEAVFFFIIKPSKTEYHFTGRIDQLMKTPTESLFPEFPEFQHFEKDTVVIHRDTKFGRRRETSAFELALNIQFDVYALALKEGVFEVPGSEEPVGLDLIPDFHALYFLQDHIPYKSDGGSYKKDEDDNYIPCHIWQELGLPGPCLLNTVENYCQGKRKSCTKQLNKKGEYYTSNGPYLKDDNGEFIPCDVVPTPCLLSKKEYYCEGLRSWCTKQKRGNAMYFTKRPLERLEAVPTDLGRICASIRMGHHPRRPSELCFNYCEFRSVCEAEVMQELEAA